MAKKFKYTIGIDPSGSYKEGNGTTGWCVLDNKTNTVVQVGQLSAWSYSSCHEYWQAHIDLIHALIKQYGKRTAVSIEDYILYKNQAMAQVNSQLETPQLLGIIKQACYNDKVCYFIRPAVAVKTRWSDDILVHKGILVKLSKHYIIPNLDSTHMLCDHERDAIRHAVHFNTFENREEK